MTCKRVMVLVALGAVLGVGALATAQPKPLHLRIAVHTQTVGARDVIAIRQGYFKQERSAALVHTPAVSIRRR